MKYSEIIFLLKEIGIIKKQHDYKRSNEELFNIFSVLHKNHDERRLHSRFVANLLNPYASHLKDTTFLQLFFKEIGCEEDFDNFKTIDFYPKEIEKKEYKNIDIYIVDRTTKHALIIENKIYAGDSNSKDDGQLERYFDLVLNEGIPKNNIKTVYLTLNGKPPSPESIGRYETLENINGMLISYGTHITNWLNQCLAQVSEQPFLREAIIQYKKLLEKMTNNNTQIEERLELKKEIGKSIETVESAIYLLDNFKHIKWHTIYEFWKELEDKLTKSNFKIQNYKIKESVISAITHSETNTQKEDGGIYFTINEHLTGFIWHQKDNPIYWGIQKTANENQKFDQKLALLTKQKELKFADKGTPQFWWAELYFENGKELYLKNFSEENTYQLINPELRDKTVKHIVSTIKNFISTNLS